MNVSLTIDGHNAAPDLGLVDLVIREGVNLVTDIELLLAATRDDIDIEDKPGARVCLKLTETEGAKTLANRFDGEIFKFARIETPWADKSILAFKALVRPKPWVLSRYYRRRVLREITRPDAVERILSDDGFTADLDYKLQLLDRDLYPDVEQIVQDGGSDLDLSRRLLAESGVNFIFRRQGSDDSSSEMLVLVDDNSFFSSPHPEPFPYIPSSGLIAKNRRVLAFAAEAQYVPGLVYVRTHHQGTTRKIFEAERRIPGGGEGRVELFGIPGDSQRDADWWAKLRAEEIGCEHWLAKGQSNVFVFRSGERISLDPDPMNSPGAQYLLIRIDHHLSQTPQAATAPEPSDFSYRNSFSAVKGDAPYRPNYLKLPFRTLGS